MAAILHVRACGSYGWQSRRQIFGILLLPSFLPAKCINKYRHNYRAGAGGSSLLSSAIHSVSLECTEIG